MLRSGSIFQNALLTLASSIGQGRTSRRILIGIIGFLDAWTVFCKKKWLCLFVDNFPLIIGGTLHTRQKYGSCTHPKVLISQVGYGSLRIALLGHRWCLFRCFFHLHHVGRSNCNSILSLLDLDHVDLLLHRLPIPAGFPPHCDRSQFVFLRLQIYIICAK